MERHTEAKAARLEFGAYLERLKRECGIERAKVAEILGIIPSKLSKMAAGEVRERPATAPPPNWKAELRDGLRRLAGEVARVADELAPESGEAE